jgi:hypothetical protein
MAPPVRYQGFKIIDIHPFYRVTEASGKIILFETLKEISKNYHLSLPSLSRSVNGIKIPCVDFEIYKEPFPFIWEYQDERFESESASDITRLTGISTTHISYLIKKFLAHRAKIER